jgi:hypothetical protein
VQKCHIKSRAAQCPSLEIFSLFNRVQFGLPNESITTAANPTTGYVTTQINQPRLIQLALRLVF